MEDSGGASLINDNEMINNTAIKPILISLSNAIKLLDQKIETIACTLKKITENSSSNKIWSKKTDFGKYQASQIKNLEDLNGYLNTNMFWEIVKILTQLQPDLYKVW